MNSYEDNFINNKTITKLTWELHNSYTWENRHKTYKKGSNSR